MLLSSADERSKILSGAHRVLRGEPLETVGAGAGYGDVLESVQKASAQLSRFRTGPDIPEHALPLALELTRSTGAVFALAEDGGGGQDAYTAVQQRTFAIFAHQVASAIGLAQLQERRQEMVDTLVNLRADLDRSERQRLINDERAQSAERVEHAHEAAVQALLAVSRHARTGHGLADFYRRLTRSIAELVTAEKVLFWQLDEEGLLHP